jgi:hypothetical protein
MWHWSGIVHSTNLLLCGSRVSWLPVIKVNLASFENPIFLDRVALAAPPCGSDRLRHFPAHDLTLASLRSRRAKHFFSPLPQTLRPCSMEN